jgi:hypothetical protein
MLLRIYDALVLSKLNYGAELCDTASKTSLADLDVVTVQQCVITFIYLTAFCSRFDYVLIVIM